MNPLRFLSLSIALSVTLGLSAGVVSSVQAGTMIDRVCPRVVNRFANDETMWQRVNERVQNHFGFRCSRPEPTRSGSAAKSSQPAQAKSAKSAARSLPAQRAIQCFESDWQCTPWRACHNGKQNRKCQVANKTCYSPELARPDEVKACDWTQDMEEERVRAKAKKSLEAWREFHGNIVTRAEAYLKQPAGQTGLITLGEIEKRFLVQFNSFIDEYNSAIGGWMYDNAAELDAIEAKLVEIKKEFDALPLIYY